METSHSGTAFKLNNGLWMPKVGLGTYRIKDKDTIVKAIVDVGYRHIDTAWVYENEDIVGDAIEGALEKSAGKIKREDLFVVTKIWHNHYEDPEAALREQLKKLKLDYVDCYLIHWPAGFFTEKRVPLHVLWEKLEALVDKGLTKSLGISNFNLQLTADLLCYARHKPVCNQIELHPFVVQEDLVKFLFD
jgi:aldehyde reductase